MISMCICWSILCEHLKVNMLEASVIEVSPRPRVTSPFQGWMLLDEHSKVRFTLGSKTKETLKIE